MAESAHVDRSGAELELVITKLDELYVLLIRSIITRSHCYEGLKLNEQLGFVFGGQAGIRRQLNELKHRDQEVNRNRTGIESHIEKNNIFKTAHGKEAISNINGKYGNIIGKYQLVETNIGGLIKRVEARINTLPSRSSLPSGEELERRKELGEEHRKLTSKYSALLKQKSCAEQDRYNPNRLFHIEREIAEVMDREADIRKQLVYSQG